MANHFLEMQNGATVIHFEGAATIDTAALFHQTIVEALDNQTTIVLDTLKVTECDTSFVQLICSLCHTLSKGGRALAFSQETVAEPVCQAIKSLGFHMCGKRTNNTGKECLFPKINKNSANEETHSL
jgi:anti-anti-sigma regulatory factor